MDYKAFKIEKNIDLLLFRDVDVDNAYPIVKIYAYWDDHEEFPMLSEETVSFENTPSAKAFIRDFTNDSAKEWCEKNIPADEK